MPRRRAAPDAAETDPGPTRPVATAKEDVIALALFAQRSPNLAFREQAFRIAFSALADEAPTLGELGPLCQFAARSQAKGVSAGRAREVGRRLLLETGHTDLQAQLRGSIAPNAEEERKAPGARSRARQSRAR